MSFTMVNSLPAESEFRLAQSILPWEEAAEARLQRDDLPRLPEGCGLTMMFPAYNDAHTIGALVDYSARVLPKLASDFEIVVVNDGSPDATADVLAERQRLYPFLRVVTHASNQGYGAALRSGFAAATKSHVFYTDGDGQYDPTEVASLIPRARRERHGQRLQALPRRRQAPTRRREGLPSHRTAPFRPAPARHRPATSA